MSVRSNLIWYGIPRILDRFAAVLLLPLYTRVLKPEEFGAAAVALAVGTLAGLVVAPGTETVYLRFMGRSDGNEGGAIAVALLHLAILGAGTLIFLTFAEPLAAMLMPGIQPRLYYVAVATTALSTVSAPLRAEWRAQHRADKVALLEAIQCVVSVTTIVVTLIWLRWGAVSILMGGLSASLVTLPTGARKLRQLLSQKWLRDGFRQALPLVGVALPIGVYEYAFVTVDRLLLNRFSGAAEVALYVVSYQIGAAMMMVGVTMNKEWRPLVFNLGAAGHSQRAVLQGLWTRSLCVFLALGGVIAVSAHDIVRVVSTSDYAASANIIPWVVLVGTLRVPRVLLINLALAYGKARDLFIESTVSLALFVIANILLIPRFGAIGAAWSGVIAYAAGTVFLYARPWNVYRLERVLLPWTALCVAGVLIGSVGPGAARFAGVALLMLLAFEMLRYWRFLGLVRPVAVMQ